MHPNDNGDSAADIALLTKLSTDPSKATTNYRQFSIGSGGGRNDDFNTWTGNPSPITIRVSLRT